MGKPWRCQQVDNHIKDSEDYEGYGRYSITTFFGNISEQVIFVCYDTIVESM